MDKHNIIKSIQITHWIRVECTEYIKNTCSSKIKRHNSIRMWSNDLNIYISKENVPIANNHMKICSVSLTIRAKQVKTTMRYLFISTWMPKLKMIVSSVNEDME